MLASFFPDHIRFLFAQSLPATILYKVSENIEIDVPLEFPDTKSLKLCRTEICNPDSNNFAKNIEQVDHREFAMWISVEMLLEQLEVVVILQKIFCSLDGAYLTNRDVQNLK